MLMKERDMKKLISKPLLSITIIGISVFGSSWTAAQDSSPSTPGTFATFTGNLAIPGQIDSFVLDVDAENFELNDKGGVELVFLLSATEGSNLDPGLIRVKSSGTGQIIHTGPLKPDTAESTASLILATLTPGSYSVALFGEHKTMGAYKLEVFLVGDATGDLRVTQDDIDFIENLSKTNNKNSKYNLAADIDRNGVINAGDAQRAKENFGASARTENEDLTNPIDQSLPLGALSVVGASPPRFYNITDPLQFKLEGAEFYSSIEDINLTINGHTVPAANLALESTLISATSVLVNGRNEISLVAVDSIGRPLYLSTTLWAGSANLNVQLLNEDGALYLGSADVFVSLSDDQAIQAHAVTTTGIVEFHNLPTRTILINAKSSESNIIGFGNAVGGDETTVQIVMKGFKPSSSIDNNDFSLGTLGWEIGDASVEINPHIENFPNAPLNSISKSLADGIVAKNSLGEKNRTVKRGNPSMLPAEPNITKNTISNLALDSLVDDDLTLSTSGEGGQSISRTFNTTAGANAVLIRYRFITSEVPGGFYGSQYNDNFSINIRSQNAQDFVGESNSMNGLDLGAFDYSSGSTMWHEIKLPVKPDGDTIQADITVANVGDDQLDSQVVVDFIQELADQVQPALSWTNTGGGLNLSYAVTGGNLLEDTTISIFWANGTTYANRIGGALFDYIVPVGTTSGQHGPIHVSGALLSDNPTGASHLIAASTPTKTASLPDVFLIYGPQANATVVSAGMKDVVKDGLRAAGQTSNIVTSTARTPFDQARAMFINLVNPKNTIAQNISNQKKLYAPPGDAVINIFIAETNNLTYDEIIQGSLIIRAKMEKEINVQGPPLVSRHCADPATISVIDIWRSGFNSQNRPLFMNAVQERVYLINEPKNDALHLELGVVE